MGLPGPALFFNIDKLAMIPLPRRSQVPWRSGGRWETGEDEYREVPVLQGLFEGRRGNEDGWKEVMAVRSDEHGSTRTDPLDFTA